MKFVACMCVLFVMSFPLSAEIPALFPGQVFSTGEKPVSVVASDFNNDGYIDMAVANQNSNDVSVMLGDGVGGFLATTQYSVGEKPQTIYCADFNNDNRADLAVAYAGTGIHILMGNDSGGFLDAVNHMPGESTVISGADVDNNGYFESAYVSDVSLCDGTGGFITGELLIYGNAAYNVTADFNGDGNIDVMLEKTGSSIKVSSGDGTGVFSEAIVTEYPANVSFSSEFFASADFNADGYADLVTTDLSGQVVILISDGTGGFLSAENFPVFAGEDVSPHSVTTSDFNGDGYVDVVVGSLLGSDISVLLGDGDGGFLTATNYGAGFSPIVKTVADIDNDGFLDLIYIAGYNGVGVLSGDGRGGFHSSTNYTTETEIVNHVTSADFNGDGYSDIAAATTTTPHTNSISVLLGDGAGGFSSPVNYYDDQLKPITMVSGDFNNDGNDDLVVFSKIDVGQFNISSISVLLSDGEGGFSSSRKYLENAASSALITDDFNNDGLADIAVFGATLNILLNDGAGGFSVVENSFDTASSIVEVITSADFNGDGYVDIAGTSFVFGTKVFLGNGGGDFVLGEVYATEVGNNITHEDFNRDGFIDLAITEFPPAENEESGVKILLGDGAGSFTTISKYGIGDQMMTSIASADFNGDNYADIVVTGILNDLILLVNDGTGGFYAEPKHFSAGALSRSIAVSDFDGNGRADIATDGYDIGADLSTMGAVIVLLNRSGSPVPNGSINIDGGNFATNNEEVVLSLSCNDDVECTLMQISNDNMTWGEPVTYAGSMNWTLAEGADGQRTVYARFMDEDGNTSTGVSDEIRIDRVAPEAPVILMPADNGVADILLRPTISGTAENGSTIVVRNGMDILGMVTVASNNWSMPGNGVSLVEGVHEFTATATDQAGNVSPVSQVVVYSVDPGEISGSTDTGSGGGGGGGNIGYFILFILVTIFGYRSVLKYSQKVTQTARRFSGHTG